MSENTQDVMRPLPKYKCHKEVWALKIGALKMDGADDPQRETDGSAIITPADERYGSFRVNHEYMRKHNPQPGGYYVLYADGYKSFSPADAFEKGYILI